MNSPITGQPMILVDVKHTVNYKGFVFEVAYKCWEDPYNGEQYEDEEQINDALNQVYEKYKVLTSRNDNDDELLFI